MLERFKKLFKKFSLLIPFIIFLFILTYFVNMLNYLTNAYYKGHYEDCKQTVNIIADTIEILRQEGLSDDIIFEKVMKESLNDLDREVGVYLRVLTLDHENVPIGDQLYGSNFEYNIFTKSNPDFENICYMMENKLSGEIKTYTPEGKEIILYWKVVPETTPKYYLVMGVSHDIIQQTTRFNDFQWGITIITGIVVFLILDNFWLRTNRKCIKNEQK